MKATIQNLKRCRSLNVMRALEMRALEKQLSTGREAVVVDMCRRAAQEAFVCETAIAQCDKELALAGVTA